MFKVISWCNVARELSLFKKHQSVFHTQSTTLVFAALQSAEAAVGGVIGISATSMMGLHLYNGNIAGSVRPHWMSTFDVTDSRWCFVVSMFGHSSAENEKNAPEEKKKQNEPRDQKTLQAGLHLSRQTFCLVSAAVAQVKLITLQMALFHWHVPVSHWQSVSMVNIRNLKLEHLNGLQSLLMLLVTPVRSLVWHVKMSALNTAFRPLSEWTFWTVTLWLNICDSCIPFQCRALLLCMLAYPLAWCTGTVQWKINFWPIEIKYLTMENCGFFSVVKVMPGLFFSFMFSSRYIYYILCKQT